MGVFRASAAGERPAAGEVIENKIAIAALIGLREEIGQAALAYKDRKIRIAGGEGGEALEAKGGRILPDEHDVVVGSGGGGAEVGGIGERSAGTAEKRGAMEEKYNSFQVSAGGAGFPVFSNDISNFPGVGTVALGVDENRGFHGDDELNG